MYVGTAALGCPAERSSAMSDKKIYRAPLDRTAEGGCPHVVPYQVSFSANCSCRGSNAAVAVCPLFHSGFTSATLKRLM